jgi:hypothetical protein
MGSIPDEVIRFFNWANPSSSTNALGVDSVSTEMSTRNIPGGKGSMACKGNILTAICETTVYKMWDLPLSQPYGPLRLVITLPFTRKPKRRPNEYGLKRQNLKTKFRDNRSVSLFVRMYTLASST